MQQILSCSTGQRATGPLLTHTSWKGGSSSLQPSLWPWIKSLPSGTVFLKWFTLFHTHAQKGPVTVRPKLQSPRHGNRSFHTLAVIQHGSHPTSGILCQTPTKDFSRLSPRQRLTCWPLGVHWSLSALKPIMCKTFTEPGSLQQADPSVPSPLHQSQSKNRSSARFQLWRRQGQDSP